MCKVIYLSPRARITHTFNTTGPDTIQFHKWHSQAKRYLLDREINPGDVEVIRALDRAIGGAERERRAHAF